MSRASLAIGKSLSKHSRPKSSKFYDERSFNAAEALALKGKLKQQNFNITGEELDNSSFSRNDLSKTIVPTSNTKSAKNQFRTSFQEQFQLRTLDHTQQQKDR